MSNIKGLNEITEDKDRELNYMLYNGIEFVLNDVGSASETIIELVNDGSKTLTFKKMETNTIKILDILKGKDFKIDFKYDETKSFIFNIRVFLLCKRLKHTLN